MFNKLNVLEFSKLLFIQRFILWKIHAPGSGRVGKSFIQTDSAAEQGVVFSWLNLHFKFRICFPFRFQGHGLINTHPFSCTWKGVCKRANGVCLKTSQLCSNLPR
uniref:Uncharacterized protein n=1 Tax=Cacopsylla melanoneura TaxID=428564 RepID=A0A8D9AP78_9HEMI